MLGEKIFKHRIATTSRFIAYVGARRYRVETRASYLELRGFLVWWHAADIEGTTLLQIESVLISIRN